MSEARAILVELNQSPTKRPLTHELFVSLSEQFGCRLVEVDIVHYDNGVYFADMQMTRADNTVFTLDARPSDAIALALKEEAPFYIDAAIFNDNCLVDNVIDEPEEPYNPTATLSETQEIRPDAYIEQKLLEMSTSELNTLLDGAVESEDYELASKIQEELNRRKNI